MRKPHIESCSEILRRMVTVNTSQPACNEAVLVDQIEEIFAPYPVEKRRFDHGNNRSSLIIKLPGEAPSGGLALLAHLDTVAFGDESLWRHPPLGCEMEGRMMFGRGTADMKGGAAAMVETALCLLENKTPLQKPVLLCFTADEEVNGIGVVSLLDCEWMRGAEEAIICEPSDEKIGVAEKGALWLRLNVKGKSAHGSRPEIGVNALDYAIRFIERLRARIDTEATAPFLGGTTMSLNRLEGGFMTNVIPDKAMLELDIRTIPCHNHADICQSAQEICDELQAQTAGLEMTLTVLNNRAAVATSPDHPFIGKLQEVCKELGMPADCRGLLFYTDASQLIPAIPMPFVIFGPGDDKQAHQINEHIDVESVPRLASAYLTYIMKHLAK